MYQGLLSDFVLYMHMYSLASTDQFVLKSCTVFGLPVKVLIHRTGMCVRVLCGPDVLRVLRCRLRNRAAREALLWPAWLGQHRGVRLPQAEAKRWASVLQEYSMRCGTLVSGWWIDGCYGRILNYTDRHLQMYTDAIKAGNPHAIVAFNSDGMPVTTSRRRCTGSLDLPVIDCYSRFEQFTCGESNAQLSFADVPAGRSVDGIQWHKLAYLGTYWGAGSFNPFPPLSGKPNVSAMRQYSMAVAQGGGAFTLDVQLFRNGSINRAQTSFLADAWNGL